MLDSFNRDIYYLRISVINKCNLRCRYCIPIGMRLNPVDIKLLSINQIVKVVKVASELGFWKIRLTGGEPLLRKDIITLVKNISLINHINFLGMTTNGILLEKYAYDLRMAGLTSINVSLDTLNESRFSHLTSGGKLIDVLKGIDAACKVGLPVKINMVILEDTSTDEIYQMRQYCNERQISLQLIGQFCLNQIKIDNNDFDRPPKCEICNRIRLTADGYLKPCLHSNYEVKLKMYDIKTSFIEALRIKPYKGFICNNRSMQEIGG